MDFSRFTNIIKEQREVFNGIKSDMNASTFDDICIKLNSTLSDIALVASVIPVSSRAELIGILKDLRSFAIELSEYKKKFTAPVEYSEPIIDEEVNTEEQSNDASLSNGNEMKLALSNPNAPKGAYNNQFQQAA